MAIHCDPHLGHLQANILHKINYSGILHCMLIEISVYQHIIMDAVAVYFM